VDALRPLADFLLEATTCFGLSLPTHVLNIHIEGYLDESVSAWRMIKQVAGLQEAFKDCDYMAQHQEIRLSELLVHLPDNTWHPSQFLDFYAFERRFQLPCDLPRSFYQTIRHITEGSSFIHFDGDAGSPWDAATETAARKTWTLQEFADEWFEKLGIDGGWHYRPEA
jgi:hypothetical protein